LLHKEHSFFNTLFFRFLCAIEPDSWKNGCQQSEGCGIQDSICDDGHTETAKTNKKMEESLEPSGENNNCEQVEISSKDGKKVPMKLEVSSGVQTTSSIVEQEVHSGFVGVEVSVSHILTYIYITEYIALRVKLIDIFVYFGALAWLCCFYFMMCCRSLQFFASQLSEGLVVHYFKDQTHKLFKSQST
jgi:hypothetical protein